MLAACGATVSNRHAATPSSAVSAQKDAPRNSALEFLLDAAAKDFRDHRPPEPARFRKVRLGYTAAGSGGRQYRLCGEFLPKQASGKADWTPFATIKTSGYEQWLGAQAIAYCQGVTFDPAGDLSARLWKRFESGRSLQ